MTFLRPTRSLHPSILSRPKCSRYHKMSARANSTEKAFTRPTFSCVRCAERKVKCDREKPCSACTKHNIDCVFNTTKPPRKKHKRIKVQVLVDRLNQYESLLEKHGIDRDELPNVVDLELPSRPSPTDPEHPEISSRPNVSDRPSTNTSTAPSASRYEFTNLNIIEK
jgi:hypothetical protein